MKYRIPNWLALTCTAFLTAAVAGLLAWRVSSSPAAYPDFAMLWGATQVQQPYDATALRSALGWGPGPLVIFIYPPSALPIFAPFGLLALRPALALWAALSGAALALSSRSKWAPVLLFTPPVIWALPGGQTSVLVGSLLFAGLQLVQRRPILSGIVFGIVLCIKPQFGMIVPLALLILRRWNAVAAAGATVALVTAVAAALYGAQLWTDWIQALPGFLALHAKTAALRHNEIAFGLPVWLRVSALIGGIFLTAKALDKDDTAAALGLSICAALIASSHAMGYEFAVLSPIFVALIARRGWAASAMLIFIVTPAAIWAVPGILTYAPRLVAVLLLTIAIVVDGWLDRGPRPESQIVPKP